jgi:hypothetical protein
MTAAPLWLRTNEKLLENADRGAGWRFVIIESAGEPHLRAHFQTARRLVKTKMPQVVGRKFLSINRLHIQEPSAL